jgi:HPt (histidine-containing phosphotransfer) domain-containing protein
MNYVLLESRLIIKGVFQHMSIGMIDLKVFIDLKETMGADFIGELLDTYFEDTPGLIRTMKEALVSSDAEAFRRAAHSMKSNSASFGAMQLSTLAKELEMLGKENNLAGVGDKVERLENDYFHVQRELSHLKAS